MLFLKREGRLIISRPSLLRGYAILEITLLLALFLVVVSSFSVLAAIFVQAGFGASAHSSVCPVALCAFLVYLAVSDFFV